MKLFCNLVLLAAIAAVALSQDEYKDPHRKCYPPKRPEHGGYDTDYKDYSVGHKLTYYCDDGYDLYGSKYSTCGYSDYDKKGYWSKEPPYCKRNANHTGGAKFTQFLFFSQKEAVSEAEGPTLRFRETVWNIPWGRGLVLLRQRIQISGKQTPNLSEGRNVQWRRTHMQT